MCSDLSLPCPFAGDRLASAPQAHALDTRLAQAVAPGQERDHARAQARAALRRLLAAVLGCAPQALSVSDARGIPPRLGWTTGGRSGLDAIGLSISHAPGLSLVAWCPKGAVGVDVQAVPYATDRAELWRTAALFFPPDRLEALAEHASDALFSEAFAGHWAAHEAALKCLGQGLVEYTPTLAARLAGVRTAALTLPGWAAADMVAAIAWRP